MSFFPADVSYLGTLNAKKRSFTHFDLVMWSFMWFDFSTQMGMLGKMIAKVSNIFWKASTMKFFLIKLESLLCKLQLYYNQNSTQFFSEYVAQNLIPSSTTDDFPRGFSKIALYKLLERFLRDIVVIPYLTKLQASNLLVGTLLKSKCLTKTCKTNF